MVMERSHTETRATYHEVLFRHGFLDRHADAATAWGLYQRVAEDKTIVKLSQTIERPKYRMVSVTSGYQRFGQALAMLTARQLTALKKRVGIKSLHA
jgi:hypothetical protein